MVKLLQALVKLNQILVQSLRIHIEKLIFGFVLCHHIESQHYRPLRLMIDDIISLNNCDLIVIKDVFQCLKLVDMPVSGESSTLSFFLRIPSSDLNRRRFRGKKLGEADLNLTAWSETIYTCLADFQATIGLARCLGAFESSR